MKNLTFLTAFLTLVFCARANTKLIPQSCNTLVKIDFDKIRQIPAIKSLGAAQMQNFKSIGLTPDKISSITIALDTGQILTRPQEFQTKPQALFLLTMKEKFDYQAAIKMSKNKEIVSTQSTFHGIAVSSFKKSGRDFAISQLNETTLVIGGKDIVENSILLQLQKNSNSLKNNRELSSLIKSSENIISLYSLIPAIPPQSANLAMLSNFTSLVIDVNYDSNLLVNSSATCKSEQIAQQMNAILNMAVGMQLAKPDAPLKAENINISQNKKELQVKLKLSTENLTHILIPLMLNRTK